MRARGLLWPAATAAMMGVGGCHLLIGYKDGVLAEGSGGTGGASPCATDGIKNDDETGVDCGGGLCSACPDGEGCIVGTDCESLICIAGTCRPPACGDGIQNGAETDLDCGGGTVSGCAGCDIGSHCQTGTDCASGVCEVMACIDHFVWAKQFGPLGEASITAATAGAPAVTGILDGGTVNLGGDNLLPSEGTFAIARYASQGEHVWSQAFGQSGFAFATDITTDLQENNIIIGYFSGSIDFGGSPLTSAGGDDVFIAKMTSSGGHAWSKRFGDNVGQGGYGVAVDPEGNVLATGNFGGTLDFGGTPLTSGGAFIAKLSPTGAHIWSRSFAECNGWHVAADGAGNVYLAGDLMNSVVFGGGSLPTSGSNDRYFVKLSPSGTHVWSMTFSLTYLAGIAPDPTGNLVASGWFSGTVDFGGGPLTSEGGDDSYAAFLVKFSPSGDHLWSKRFTGASSHYCGGLAVDAAGNIILRCSLGTPVDFGAVVAQGPVVLKFDPNGNYLWSRPMGDDGGSFAVADLAAPDPEHILLVGNLGGTFDLGGGPMTSESYGDLVLAKFRVPASP